jgi:hypothetical protein
MPQPSTPPPPGFEPDTVVPNTPPPLGFVPDPPESHKYAYESPGSGTHTRPIIARPHTPDAGGFFGGLGDQLGVTPTALHGSLDAINPIAQYGHAKDALHSGHYGDAFNRGAQAGLDLVPGGGLAIPVLEHLASDPYDLIQRGESETNPSKRAGYAAAALVPVLGRQVADIGEEYGTNTPHAVGRTVGLLAPLLAGGARGDHTPAFDPAHIRQTFAERTNSPAALAAENVLERSLPGSIPFRAHRLAALADTDRIGADLASRVSSASITPEQLGDVVLSQIQRGVRLKKFAINPGDPLDVVAGTKPEAVHKLLVSDKLSLNDVRVLNKRLGSDTMRAMAAQNIKSALDDFTHSRNPQAFAKALRTQMGDGKLALAINDPSTVRAINQFIAEAEKTPAPKGVATSPLSGGNLVLEALGASGHLIGAPAAPAFYGAAKLATSPEPWIAARNALGRAGSVLTGTAAAGAITQKQDANSGLSGKPNVREYARQMKQNNP